MVLTFRYRILPSKAQHRALEQTVEMQRQLYNAALQERIGAYRAAGLTLTYFDQTKGLSEWRRSDPEARALPVNLQRATLKRVDEAYRGFFRRLRSGGKPGFPRFRGKGWFDSFAFTDFEGITLRHGRLRFKGMPGGLRIHWHRELPGVAIKKCTFKRDTKGWVVGFAVDIGSTEVRRGSRAVGIDLGISTFAALSDGGAIPSLRASRRAARRMRLAQRALARKVRDSNGRIRARAVVARCHAAVGRQRREHLHQASARLAKNYDVLVFERLNVSGLARSALARDVRDASWSLFVLYARYKAERAGKRVIEVDPQYTTQDCSGCGTRVPKTLEMRRHDCPDCGLSLDRDVNAARNILSRAGVGPGLLNVAGCGMRADENLGLHSSREGATMSAN